MTTTNYNLNQLEILVSTMYRTDLDFVYKMFKNNNIALFNILVVNQTDSNRLLESSLSNIKVVNSFEKGLSKSRNIAIKEATGAICLIADDDVVYLSNFHIPILAAYNNLPKADVITFKTLTFKGKSYSDYPKKVVKLNRFIKKVLSIELSFKRKTLINNTLSFNENFGIGSVFEDSENYIFLNECRSKFLNMYVVPEFIVQHESVSSSDDVSLDRYIYARSALNYKLYANLAYLYLVKLLFFLVRKGGIGIKVVWHKYKIGVEAIRKYKELYP